MKKSATIVAIIGFIFLMSSAVIYLKKPSDGPLLTLVSQKIYLGDPKVIDHHFERPFEILFKDNSSIRFQLERDWADYYKELCKSRCKISFQEKVRFNLGKKFWKKNFVLVSIEPM